MPLKYIYAKIQLLYIFIKILNNRIDIIIDK